VQRNELLPLTPVACPVHSLARHISSMGHTFLQGTRMTLYLGCTHAAQHHKAMSSWAYGEGDRNGNRRLGASVHIFDIYLDPFNWSEIQENTFSQETTIITDDHPSVPVLSHPPLVCSHLLLASSAKSFSSIMSFDIYVEAVETSESPGPFTHIVGLTPQHAVSPLSISGSVEDRIPGLPMQSQQCLNDEENGTNALMTTRPLSTPTDDSRSFGFLVDATDLLACTHSSHMDHQCLGQSATKDCLAAQVRMSLRSSR